MLQRIAKSTLAKNASVLFAGTLLAQVVPFLISPILTRLYSPAEFGTFALFMGIAAVVGICATGRYELATLIPKSDRAADAITALVFLTSAATALAAFLIFSLNRSFQWFQTADLGRATPTLFGTYALVFGFTQALNYQRNRRGDFKRIAISRVTQAIASGLVQISAGFLGMGGIALVMGTIVGQASATSILGVNLPIDKTRVTCRLIKRQAAHYLNFPLYSLPADLINTVTNQLPIFFLASQFGIAAGGFYGLTQRVLAMPVSLLANSVADVFKGQASRDYVQLGNCRAIYMKTIIALCALALVPFTAFAYWAPAIFRALFGNEWNEAGEYAQVMAILYLFRFVASPLGHVLYIAEKQRVDLAWQVCLCVVAYVALWTASITDGPKGAIQRFVIGYSAMYVVYLGMSFYYTKRA